MRSVEAFGTCVTG